MLEQLFELENQFCQQQHQHQHHHQNGLSCDEQAKSCGQHQEQRQRLPDETRQELERDWIKMERLTTELRLSLLAELTRVVHKNGKLARTIAIAWARGINYPNWAIV